MTAGEKIWYEKYRPSEFSEYVYPIGGLKDQVNEWFMDTIFPNLILHGIQGTGKSTFARMLIKNFNIPDDEVLRINGSTQNKMDTFRDVIEPFCKMRPIGCKYKVVLIEEAHRLTPAVQQSLYDTIEQRLNVRFIFTTNYIAKIEAPLLSRMNAFDFNEHDDEAALERIVDILEVEAESDAIDVDDDEVMDKVEAHYNKHKPDLRATIKSIQNSIVDKKIGYPSAGGTSAVSFEAWEALWSGDNFDFDTAISLAENVDNSNYDDYYAVIYKALPDLLEADPDMIGDIVIELSEFLFKAMNNQGGAAVQRIHLEAFLYRMKGITNGE